MNQNLTRSLSFVDPSSRVSCFGETVILLSSGNPGDITFEFDVCEITLCIRMRIVRIYHQRDATDFWCRNTEYPSIIIHYIAFFGYPYTEIINATSDNDVMDHRIFAASQNCALWHTCFPDVANELAINETGEPGKNDINAGRLVI